MRVAEKRRGSLAMPYIQMMNKRGPRMELCKEIREQSEGNEEVFNLGIGTILEFFQSEGKMPEVLILVIFNKFKVL